MSTMFNRSSLYKSGYANNSLLKLILALGVIFVIFHFMRAIMLMVGSTQTDFFEHIVTYIALPDIHHFGSRFWTLFTYGWFPTVWSSIGFWDMLCNMIWIWWFASPLQMLVGNKQVIPIFFYSFITGGVFYLLAQFIPGALFIAHPALIGPQAGILGLGIAALTLEPKYRYFIADRFSMPLWVAVSIYAVLVLLGTITQPLILMYLAGGALTGFLYIRALRAGYRPGDWIYALTGGIAGLVTPSEQASWRRHNKKRNEVLNKIHESKQTATQRRVDEILDKINQKGYNALTAEEKSILLNAGESNQ